MYSHRNGTTEPPTEAGDWKQREYWAKGVAKFKYDTNRLGDIQVAEKVVILLSDSGEPEWVRLFQRELALCFRLEEVLFQWWGPIMPPWEAPAPEPLVMPDEPFVPTESLRDILAAFKEIIGPTISYKIATAWLDNLPKQQPLLMPQADMGVSMQEAQDMLVRKFGLSYQPKLKYTIFEHMYPDSSGPMGGAGGQAITNFWLSAWFDPHDGYAVVFYGAKVLKLMGFGEFQVHSTYRGY